MPVPESGYIVKDVKGIMSNMFVCFSSMCFIFLPVSGIIGWRDIGLSAGEERHPVVGSSWVRTNVSRYVNYYSLPRYMLAENLLLNTIHQFVLESRVFHGWQHSPRR